MLRPLVAFDAPRAAPYPGRRVPLPAMLLWVFAAGLFAALAGRTEIKLSPRPPLLMRAFAAYAGLVTLVIVPISIYFYLFHGDWFLLYLWDVRTIPSAIALVGFVVEAVLGALGFVLGASLVRSQREPLTGVLGAAALVAAAGSILAARERLMVVGSYAQYVGGFGLGTALEGPMLHGLLAMGGLLILGTGAVLGRISLASSRG